MNNREEMQKLLILYFILKKLFHYGLFQLIPIYSIKILQKEIGIQNSLEYELFLIKLFCYRFQRTIEY